MTFSPSGSSRRLTLAQAAAYFVEWVATGVAIGLLYRPLATR
jgi:hypothetical protein